MAKRGAPPSTPDVTILGGGPVGYLVALCLASRGGKQVSIRLITGRRTPPSDGRAAALVGRSMDILAGLGLEDAFRNVGAPLAAIRIIDSTGGLFRAPTTLFRASDTDRPDFGVSLTTSDIVALMAEAARTSPCIDILPMDVTAVERHTDGGFALVTDDGATHLAPFLVAADGQRSLAREAGGIPVRHWSYPQVALTFAVRHRRDHEDVSTEFHTRHGPFTLVPAGQGMSTVVWMTTPHEAERLAALDDVSFAHAAEKTCQSMLGQFTLASPRGSYPMRGLLAERFTAPGIALVGETGHAFPPIGAQGLNLGFRDADSLADAVVRLMARGISPGSADALADWDNGRQRDAGTRTTGVDAFNRSLLAGLLPVDALRAVGLKALKSVAPLRRAVMRAGLG